MVLNSQGGGALPTDANNKPIQVAAGIQNRDAESTPNESPLTVTDTVDEIKIPINAAVLVVRAEDADLRIGDNSTLDGTANEGYFLIEDNERQAFPVAGGTSLHVMRDAAVSVKMYFYFEMLQN